MSDPLFSAPDPLFGSSLLDQSKAHPGIIDRSIFQPKAKPVGQGTVSSDYLQRTREDNPEPEPDNKAKAKVLLSHCKFETPVDRLVVSEPFEMSCEVKAIGSEAPTALRVTFRLLASYEDDKGTTVQEDLKANWDGFLEARTESQTVKAKGTLFRPDVPLGTKLRYKLVAEHAECPDKAESPVVEVVARIDVWVQSVTIANFQDGGIVPRLDAEGMLPAWLASAITHANQKNPLGEAASVVVQGFAAKGSKGADDVELASMRARMVKALMSRDQGASDWVAVAKQHGTAEDVDQILSSLGSVYRWDLESDDARERVRCFQEECNMRFGLGLPEDGLLEAKTWGAIHRTLVSLIQEEIGEDPMAAPRWAVPKWIGAVKGAFGWGSHAPDDTGENAVEVCLVYGKNPGIVEPPKGATPAVTHNVIQKKEAVAKKPLEGKAKKEPAAAPKPAGGEIKMRYPFSPEDRKKNGATYKTGGRRFGSVRDGGKRTHGGCDLIAPVGTPIYAVADGVVGSYYEFYSQTYALEVNHGDFVARYGEIQPDSDKLPASWSDPPPDSQCKGLAPGISTGAKVKRGDLLAWVGQLRSLDKKGKIRIGSHMLHFEMYKGTAIGGLSDKSSATKYEYVLQKGYKRRKDLLDPTHYIDEADDV